MCGRDDKWLGFTADALSQVAIIKRQLPANHRALPELVAGAERATAYIERQAKVARIEDHGVEWVTRTTSIDPLCNVAMLWASLLLGCVSEPCRVSSSP
jgi:hypothetical protein